MTVTTVSRTFEAPIEEVFDLIADPVNYKSTPLMLRARLQSPRPIGVGTVREFITPVLWFREEFTAFEPPHRIGYLVVWSIPRLRHRGGEFRLRETPGGTEVTLTTEYAVPVLGDRGGRVLEPAVAAMFQTLLNSLADRCEASRGVR